MSELRWLDDSTEISPKQLLTLTEHFIREFHRKGHVDSPIPTEEDIWTMLTAVGFILFVCPATGYEAVKLLRRKREPLSPTPVR